MTVSLEGNHAEDYFHSGSRHAAVSFVISERLLPFVTRDEETSAW